ncbi:immunoglobulin superfamily member 10-like isoform X2 [Carassius gibelio]|uniref:immunoglobulin superfamily member 10-like isoform X2 n=1 Tax=Carassius gibelio TaxID=101364 RepID=UPI00227973AE|nr:immunoglobulin superfamily member 10-like isoform X2 [Carassius gibelio]
MLLQKQTSSELKGNPSTSEVWHIQMLIGQHDYCTGAQAECPVQLSQQRVVVRYRGSVAVNCSPSVPHIGMGWEASEGAVPKTSNSLITWRVSHLTEWDIRPVCYINVNHKEQCQVELSITIYKTPDSVSISIVNHTGPMIAGRQYELQCDVHDVAPVQYLTVKWYKGQTLLNQTYFTEDSKIPVNETVTLLIRPVRADNGAQYRCEAQLDLGAEGPQPPPKETSDPLYITVQFEPIINENKLPSVVPVFRGYSEEIVCEAEGNPKPTISWILGTNDIVYNEVLTISESTPENVYCVAENYVGTTTRKVKVFVQGAQAECPVQLSQQRVVVRYRGSVAVNCSPSVPHKGMGWEASEGAVPMTRDSLITWRVSHLTEWDIRPVCYINVNHKEQCQVELSITIYKTPDSVSISIVNHTGPMIEGRQYQLQCDVHDVAPVQYLTVKWYKGQTLLNQTYFTEDSKIPVNETVTLLIRPVRADNGAQYRCEAQLDLGAEGPQPPPKETSDPLYITVQFEPIINENKLPSVVPVFRGYSEEIVCEAEGNPKPTISWILGTNDIVYNEVLTISESTPEYVSCVAENYVGTTTRKVKVFVQETASLSGEFFGGSEQE